MHTGWRALNDGEFSVNERHTNAHFHASAVSRARVYASAVSRAREWSDETRARSCISRGPRTRVEWSRARVHSSAVSRAREWSDKTRALWTGRALRCLHHSEIKRKNTMQLPGTSDYKNAHRNFHFASSSNVVFFQLINSPEISCQ